MNAACIGSAKLTASAERSHAGVLPAALLAPSAMVAMIAAVAGLLAFPSANAQSSRPDLVIRNARIVDGSGSAPYRSDLAIEGDRIVRIAPRIDAAAARVIDAGGKVLAPGFIDVHTHVVAGIFVQPTADSFIHQGVTTLIEGPDGFSPVPLAPFFDQLERLPRTVNIGSFIGAGSVREAVVGKDERLATADELAKMQALVEQGMRDGAFGLSSGLVYVPGRFAPTEELVALAKVAGRLGGHYQTHLRSEGDRVLVGLREAIDIGARANIPVQITHHKVAGRKNWGRSVETLREIDAARARGQDVTIDQYPYTMSAASLFEGLIPADQLEGGRKSLRQRLQDPPYRARLASAVARSLHARGGESHLKRVYIESCDFDESLAGLSMTELTRRHAPPVNVENAAQTVLWTLERGVCIALLRDNMALPDVERILRHPATMVASDGHIGRRAGVPHPRTFGAFARILDLYVRQKKLLTLPEAIAKMSWQPAQRLRLLDRGLVKQGMKADLVLFDPQQVRDNATDDDPAVLATGMALVIVNGRIVLEDGVLSRARPGRVLHGPGKR